MSETFLMPEGISVEDTSALKNTYSHGDEGCLSAVLSAELLEKFIRGFTGLIPEPIFFFLELPVSGSDDEFELYYLDNCTAPVISTLITEYGQMLINDGLCRFGFGGNESGDEIYVQRYKVMSIYSPDGGRLKKTEKLLKDLGASPVTDLVTPWDVISEENPAVCASVEEDGISAFDLPEMLEKAGMYKAEN
ncbi:MULTISPECIES: hypothetical protein [unclassified Ruminococcus]|uniref:hypothetical protein n=1 Tax=unclassified Ruminococcus TaxID=2608920 RepID=UPI00093014BC|nr:MULTISPECIES: hypothetical protein [unclassified Ruminococcus]